MSLKIAGISLLALTMGVATLPAAQAANGDAMMHRGMMKKHMTKGKMMHHGMMKKDGADQGGHAASQQ